MVRTFFVITGATGSRKTALIHELKKRGYRCVEEVARSIIQEQTKIDVDEKVIVTGHFFLIK